MASTRYRRQNLGWSAGADERCDFFSMNRTSNCLFFKNMVVSSYPRFLFQDFINSYL